MVMSNRPNKDVAKGRQGVVHHAVRHLDVPGSLQRRQNLANGLSPQLVRDAPRKQAVRIPERDTMSLGNVL
jgi:hypothetical protein